MEQDLRYLTEGLSKVKHAFRSKDKNTAFCGRAPSWYKGVWHSDKEGLEERRMCRKCEDFLKLNTPTS
jgi:hypothetical protein